MKTEMIDHNKYSDSILSISRFVLIQQRFNFSLSLTFVFHCLLLTPEMCPTIILFIDCHENRND